MYKVFIKANVLYITQSPLKNAKGYKKVVNLEFVDDSIFSSLIPILEQEYSEPVCYCLFGADPVMIWRRYRKQYKLVMAGGGLVKNGKGRILFIFRNGRWDLPKGKADYGELIEDTSLREVKEECGLQNLILIEHLMDTYHTYDLKGSRKLKKTTWFLMHSDDEELIPQLEEGITKIKWIKEDKLDKVYENTYPSILDVIEMGIRSSSQPIRVKQSHKNMSFE